jgi:hypothetical protein
LYKILTLCTFENDIMQSGWKLAYIITPPQ